MELGVERYKEAVKSYYEAIGGLSVQNAHRLHSRWVVRQCVYHFETQMRRFQRHWRYRTVAGARIRNDAENAGKLLTPQELYADSRVLWEIKDTLRRYQVAPELHAEVESALRAKLKSLWGV